MSQSPAHWNSQSVAQINYRNEGKMKLAGNFRIR